MNCADIVMNATDSRSAGQEGTDLIVVFFRT
jgi:hypothetical protein